MKHDYYADEKDAAKWTVALAERTPPRVGVCQVAMIPNLPIPAPPHHFDAMPLDSNAAVRAFFDGERAAIAQGAPRDASRIVAIQQPIRFLNPMSYAWNARDQYFAEVINLLHQREDRHRDVILLDPCTGFSSFNQHPNDTHLDTSNVQTVWQALRPGDVLMVFQYQLQGIHAANWQHLAHGIVAGILGLPITGVRNRGLNGAVRFLCATKQ
jgi:hypothetical protein